MRRMVTAPRVRPLGPADATALAALITGYRNAMSAEALPLTESQGRALILNTAPPHLLLGAEIDGRLLGFAHCFELAEIISGQSAGQLDDLFVAPEARRTGLARALIARLADIGRARSWVHLRWLVPEDNRAARRLYESLATPAPWDSFRIDLA